MSDDGGRASPRTDALPCTCRDRSFIDRANCPVHGTDTPRTDAICGTDTYVPAMFARKLERELAHSRAAGMEEAAKICEANKQPINCRADRWKHEVCNAVRDECANAIRAAKAFLIARTLSFLSCSSRAETLKPDCVAACANGRACSESRT